jgi:hypothetical protein
VFSPHDPQVNLFICQQRQQKQFSIMELCLWSTAQLFMFLEEETGKLDDFQGIYICLWSTTHVFIFFRREKK